MMLIKMFFQCILVCTLLFNSALSNKADPVNPKKPVNLVHTCIKANEETDYQMEELSPIILLHGLGNYKEGWLGIPQILSLKTGRKVCAVDLRNHGDSPWSDDTDIEAMASDLLPLMKTLNVEKIILLGHSLGGKIAVHFALKNPNKVEKLIVEDMRPNGITDEALHRVSLGVKVLSAALSIIPKGANEREAKLAVLKFLKETYAKRNATFSLEEKNVDMLPIKCSEGRCNWKMNVNLFAKVLENPRSFMTESCGYFENPALFIYGLISPFKIGEDEEEILKLFPKAYLVGIEGADHYVHKKREFLDVVIDFINLLNY